MTSSVTSPMTSPMTSPCLLPTRDPQPPFDDELNGNVTGSSWPGPRLGRHGRHSQGALALAFALPGGLPAVPDLRLVPPIGPQPKVWCRASRELAEEKFGPQPTPRALLPEPTPWAGRLVQAVVEVTAGVRPVSQLVRWTSADVYDCVQRRLSHALSGTRANVQRQLAEVVRSVHVSEPVDGIAEVCAIVQQGARCRAIALRLEGIDGRWQCTALQIG